MILLQIHAQKYDQRTNTNIWYISTTFQTCSIENSKKCTYFSVCLMSKPHLTPRPANMSSFNMTIYVILFNTIKIILNPIKKHTDRLADRQTFKKVALSFRTSDGLTLIPCCMKPE